MEAPFPEYHPLHIFNPYVYMVSDSPRHHVYIFRWDKERGAIVGLSESVDYFKGVVKPIIFTDDYNWHENSNFGSYSFPTIEKVRDHLVRLSGVKGDSNGYF